MSEVTQLPFPEWWDEFLRDGRPREDFYDSLDRLLRYVAELPAAKLETFTSELVDLACGQAKGWSLALAALERLAGRDARHRLRAVALMLPAVHPPHPLGDYRHALLRVLAKDPNGEFLDSVDAYCNSEIGIGFTSVVWALWPHQKDRFARYYARYLAQTSPATWSGTVVVQGFATEPEALTRVRDELLHQHQSVWDTVRNDVLAACSTSWVTAEQASDIRRVCGNGTA